MYRADLSRRIGPVFADAAVDAAFDSPDKPGYPDGWGTSPHLRRSLSKTRPAPTAASYKPTHGGYPALRCCATTITSQSLGRGQHESSF